MNDNNRNSVHWSFWVIGVAALIWNVLGSVNYLMQTNPELVARFPETHQAIINGRPAWATSGFAIGVFVGALGALVMLLRKTAAHYLFVASLLGVIAATIHTVNVAASGIQFNNFELVMMIPMPVLVAGILVGYSRWAGRRGWLS